MTRRVVVPRRRGPVPEGDVTQLARHREQRFDDVAHVIAQLTGAATLGIGFRDRRGWWNKARIGSLPNRWNQHQAPAHPIRRADGAVIGGLGLFGMPPIDDATRATIGVVAQVIGRWAEDDGPAPIPEWLVVTGPVGQIRAVSPRVAELVGSSADEIRGGNVADMLHPGDLVAALESLGRTARFPGEKFPLDLRFLHRDGSTVLLEVTAEPRDEPGEHDIVFSVRDVGGRAHDDALVSDQARLLAMVGRGAPLADVLGETARLVDRTTMHHSAFLLLDVADGCLHPVGDSSLPAELVAALDGTPVSEHANTCGVAAARGQADRCADVAADARWAHVESAVFEQAGLRSCWSTPVMAGSGERALGVLTAFAPPGVRPTPEHARIADLAVGIAGVAIERHHAEVVLVHRAMHDPLTGLPNRALFIDRLCHAMEARPRSGRYVAVMLLDLDRFKVINDALGHEAGDVVLVAVAERLRSCSRAATTVARFGGDEFTVLCEDLAAPSEAIAVAHRLLDSLADPLPLGTGEVTMTMSVGVTIVSDPVDDPGSLLRDADAAMYRAKERGRNRIEVFDTTMRELALARLDLERSMYESLARGDFALAHQPEFDLATGTLIGVESLLRWRHPTRGMVPPADFIPVAEETGAILPLGEWVLERACLASLDFRERSPHPQLFTSWVNISVVQLLQPGFAKTVARIIEHTGADPEHVGLEITESAVMSDAEAAAASLIPVCDLGVRIAIDDFGTGYSSLSYLTRLPVHVLKIDRSFIQHLGVDPHASAVVGGIVQLGHAVGCSVVAEGIETPEQLHVLRALGCDVGQGFLLSHPLPDGTPLPSRVPGPVAPT